MIDHEADVAEQTRKMIDTANEIVALTEALKLAGEIYQQSKIDLIRAKSLKDKEEAKVKRLEAEGKFAEIKAKIKVKKEVINVLKMVIKAEAISA